MPPTTRSKVSQKDLQLGPFEFVLDKANDTLCIRHVNRPEDPVFKSCPGTPLIQVGFGKDDFGEGYGTFHITDRDENLSQICQLNGIEKKGSSVELSATVKFKKDTTDRQLHVTFRQYDESPSNQLLFCIRVHPLVSSSLKKVQSQDLDLKVFLNLSRRDDERLYGFGEQFSRDAVRGFSSGRIPMMTREDGVGRGLQPLSFMTNWAFGKHAAGGPTYAYKPVPFYFTNGPFLDTSPIGQSLLIENTDYSLVDLNQKGRIQIKVCASTVNGRLFYARTPLEILEEVTLFTGRMKPLPDWVMSGVIGGIQGGEKKVLDIVLKAKEHDVPLVGVWLQDWCGKRTQKVLGRTLKRLWWNWESDDVLYPGWNEFVKRLQKEHDVSVLSYVNSFLADVELGQKPGYRRNLYKEAREAGYLVKEEKNGVPLSINSGPNFQAGLTDLFHPGARKWIKSVLKDALATGVKGYMADFAEFLPPGKYTYKGLASSGDHNAYAVEWAKIQAEVLSELAVEKDTLIFHRSGFTQSPGVTRCFWSGDQLVSWDAYDGMTAGLAGLLSSGLCGLSLNHTDMGGYSTFAFSIFGFKLGYYRTQELLLRWMEFSAFQPVFRSHEGSMPDVNAQFYDNDLTWSHLRLCGLLFKSLKSYKKAMMKEAEEKGYPLMRHMMVMFPQDPICWDLNQQYMLGDKLLVRPVFQSGQTSVQVYLPSGSWTHVWTGNTYTSELKKTRLSDGSMVRIQAPLGQPCVFVKSDALHDPLLNGFFKTIQSIV